MLEEWMGVGAGVGSSERMDVYFDQAIHGGTKVAFAGIYVSLLLDMLFCFWRGEK